MDPIKQIYLLLICQGFYLGSVGQRWTFPGEITALIGSCVEIPCTYHPDGTSGSSSPLWYKHVTLGYPEILNTKDSSSVLEKYKGRTSLVPGEKSCTLRIDPVRRGDMDGYFPGIAEDKYINAHDKQSRGVYLYVTDTPNIPWLYISETLTEGEATTIRSYADHTCRSSPPTLQWNKPGRVTEMSVEISGGIWREESNLIYIPSYVDDGSDIQCTATHRNGQSITGSGTLNILYAPKNLTVTVIGKDEAMEGSDVTLQCNSFSNPDVSEYEWYKGEEKSKLPDTGREITVRNVTWNMEPYSCTAINTKGRGESALTEIPVLYAAAGVHITVRNEGEVTALICNFLSSRPDVTHYTWRKDGFILHNETGKTLTLNNYEESYGQYSCIAHNRVGESSSKEIYIKRVDMNLLLILVTVAGVFFLFFFILVIYFCLRQKKKSTLPNSPIHGTVPARIPNDCSMTKNENQYGNIQNTRQAPSIISGPSVDMKVEDNYVIYSNSEVLQPSNEVAYSVISHRQHDQERLTSSRARHAEDVEYATLRH